MTTDDEFRGKCGTCKWWGLDPFYTNERGERDRVANHHANECKRHAPGMGEMRPSQDYSARSWPSTCADDWCGDFERYKPPRHSWTIFKRPTPSGWEV